MPSSKQWFLDHPGYKLEADKKYRAKYKNNPEWRAKIKAHVLAKKRERLALTNRLKCRPCADCHIQYNPWQMDFDHRDPSTKIQCIATMVNRCFSFKKIRDEIAKCDIVCSNCHRQRTHLQGVKNEAFI